MSTHPVKSKKQSLRVAERGALEASEAPRAASPFLSFRFSYTEVSAVGDKAYVRSKETRFEEGTLTSMTFEGTADRTAFDGWIRDAQQFWLNYTTLLLKSFLGTPFTTRKRPPDAD